jgi:hypothetical protein
MQEIVMQDSSTKVIGYFAYTRDKGAVCEGDSCVIAGSRQAMEGYVKKLAESPPRGLTIKKTRFGEIMTGLQHGAPYSFDDEAYKRFLPLARQEGLDLQEEVPDSGKEGLHLVKVQWVGTRYE